MSLLTRECVAFRCRRRIPREHLMCRPHWYMVPEDIQAEVWKAYRSEYSRDRIIAAVMAARAVREAESA